MADLAPDALSRLSDLVAAGMGLHFPPERRADLERGVRAAAREFGFDDAGACLGWLLSDPSLSPHQVAVLAGHLTVGETYFWRDAKMLAAVEEHVLPALIRARRAEGARRLRLWSAGCCTGEEPYSLAILVHRLLPDASDWNVHILGTDINPRFLRRAEEGVYGEWSFRDAPDWLKERYFRATADGRRAILPEIKKRVTFSVLNLAEDAYPALANDTNAMDVIFCRNVLMYLTPAQSRKAVEGFHRALLEGGWLGISPTEATHLLRSPFVRTPLPGAILYRKESRPAAPPPAPRAESRRVDPPAPEPAAAPGPDPARPEVLALRARASANQGRLEEALAWCERALAGEKLSPGVHYLRATILQEMDDLDEAARSLRRALFLDHDFAPAHFALGNLFRRQGKLRESARHFANAHQLLQRYDPEEVLPETDGMTAGRLSEIITSLSEE